MTNLGEKLSEKEVDAMIQVCLHFSYLSAVCLQFTFFISCLMLTSFQEADEDKDGFINYEDFVRTMLASE